MNFLKSFITLLMLLTTTVVKAQVYPVQVSVATTPPYYNFLSYYGDQNNHLLIVATLTDFNAPPVNVRLRLKIQGQGFMVQTRTDVPVGNVFQLTAGFPVFIQGSDVLPLLQENALTVTSGNPDLNNLLEGFTTICVEVVEDNANGAILATNNCTAFFLQLMQPPQPNLPFCNTVVDTTDMFLTFQWSPPQNYIPSIGTDLNYTFSLYEWIDTTNYNIFQTGEGLVTYLTTSDEIIQFSVNDFPLQKGVKYVWRVQAQLTSNGVPVQMITNNGLSAPCAFYYGKPQTLAESLSDGLVINVTAQGVSSRKGLASWTVIDETPNVGLSAYNRYLVEFRPTSLEGETWNWWPDTVSGFQMPIYRLIPERTYEVRVTGIAGNFMSEPSVIVTFTTPPVREYVCGEADLPYLPTQYQPLLSAHKGDVFQIGQFALEVSDILPLGQAGHYKGRGTIPHGFLGGARIRVQFSDLLVDNQFNVREGIASAITDGVDSWLNDQYLDQAGVDTTLAGIIESGGFLNDSTVFVVVGGDSLFFQFDGSNLPIVIHGGDNVEYQFWPNGTMIVTTYGVTPSNDNLQATKNLVVRFEPASNDPSETATFDKKEYSQFSSGYEAIICQTGSPDQFIYFVPNKSKALTGTAQVKAIVHVNTAGFTPAELTFQIAGTNTNISRTLLNDSTYLLTLPQSATSYTVYAMYEGLKLGKLSVKCYEPITKKVTIVPLVAMSITEAQIETQLNQIYKGANLTIDATVAPQFNTSEFTTTTQFANPDVNVMSKYTAQMRALRDAYLADHELENGAYLIFVVPSFSNSQLDGYMVRGRGVGFLAQSTLSNVPTFTHTLAHELGHGLGALQHAWGETESLKSSTDNLMDYSSGTHLIKQQWESLRNPAPVLSFLDGDEDGSNYTVSGGDLSQVYSNLANADGSISFIDPSGRIITLPAGVQSVTFASPDSYWTTAQGNHVSENETPIGALISFKLANNDFYYASNSVSHNKFRGYERESDEQLYPNNTTPIASINHALAGIPCIVNGNVKFKICPMNKDAILANGTDPAPVGGYLIPEEKFKFLNDYITATSDAQGQIVVATFTTQLSNQVLQYLQSVRADVIGREAVYAFEVAYLLEANDIVGKCIGALTNSVQLSIQSEYENQVIIEDQANFNEFNTQVSDNTAISVSTNMPPMNINSLDLDPQIFHPTVNYGQDPDYFKKYYYTLVNWLYKINKQADYTHDALTGESIDIGAFGDFIYDQLRVDQRECYLSSLTASQRVKILREYSEWTFGSEKERLILEVLETAPEDQYSYLLTVFAEDNYSLLKGLNGDLWNGDNYRLFMDVSKMIMKVKESTISGLQNLYSSSLGQYNNENAPDWIILQKEAYQGIRIAVETNWTSSGSIRFTTTNTFPNLNVPNTVRDYDPYEIVIVQFENNYQFAGIEGTQIQKGDMVAVPAMFAYWLVEEQDKIEETVAIRVIIDLAAITASVVTVNPGPFLIADAIIASVDLTFAVTEDYILSEGTTKQKELLGNWNAFVAVVGAVNGVYLIQKVTTTALRYSYNPALLRQQFQNWKTNNLLKLEDAKEALKKIYKNTKSYFFSNNSFGTFKTEISALMREAEINRLMVDQPANAGSLSISTTGGQNQLRISNAELGNSPVDLCYIDPDDQGRMVLSAIQFMDNNPTQINKVLMVLEDANFMNASGELSLSKKLSIVKTNSGAVKVVVGKINMLSINPDMQISIQTIADLKASNLIQQPTGLATDLELAVVHRYTLNGDILNTPMRNGGEVVINSVTFSEYQSLMYNTLLTAMDKLKQTNRLVTGTVIRGRTYSLADYNALFNSGNVNVPLKGFVSCTRNRLVAEEFLTLSGGNISGPKIKVIMKIKSKNGVDIDDLSDWGVNLVNERHPNNPIQEEVLLKEGYFRKIGEPQPVLENGVPKVEIINGIEVPWIVIELEELGNPIRNIN
jgi:hypothetical protein